MQWIEYTVFDPTNCTINWL